VLLAPIIKLVRAYDSAEWEIFIREWQKGLQSYHAVERLGGPGDLGRDVIGLCSPEACQGVWDNFQCKHYETTLGASAACEDAGKIIFHAFRGEFTPPRLCSFVAPRGPSTALRKMLLNPDKFRDEVIATWDVRVAPNVVEGEKHILTGELAAYVEAYEFASFTFATLEEVLDDHRKTAFWASRFGGELPLPNPGVTPDVIAPEETVYVGKLLEVYAEEIGAPIGCADDLSAHIEWKNDLQKQRVRFYDAEAFMATYRDQTEPGTIESFADEIMDAIDPALDMASSAQDRLSTALSVAGQAAPASVLAPRAKIRVKQGVCHQLANADRVTWKI
jgi:hypothetical protein